MRTPRHSTWPQAYFHGRFAWLDDLRAIAILLMVIDHALLFFAPTNPWAGLMRCTVTRAAEPLFVFVLTTVTIYRDRPMKLSRWLQIVTVSLVTSSLLTVHLGYPVADILASLAVASVVLPRLLKLSRCFHLVALYGTAILSVVPARFGSIEFDYSVILIVYQMLLSRLAHKESSQKAATHGILSGCVVLLAACWAKTSGLDPSASVFVVGFGHPVAALAIRAIRRRDRPWLAPPAQVATHPLVIYASHLIAFAALVQLLEGASS